MSKTIKQVIEDKNPAKESNYFYASADYEDAFHDCKILLWEAVGDY